MTKNVKIDDKTHQLMSIKAAELGAQKGELCAVLILTALETTTDSELKRRLENYAPDDQG